MSNKRKYQLFHKDIRTGRVREAEFMHMVQRRKAQKVPRKAVVYLQGHMHESYVYLQDCYFDTKEQ